GPASRKPTTRSRRSWCCQHRPGERLLAEHVLNSKPFELDVSGHGYHWWHQALSIDQLDTLKKVKSPLLIVQGGRDPSVSPQKADEIMPYLKNLGKINI
ncbi:hypothetical protein ACV1DK_20525, partial [Aeromonas taiwanensis]